MAYPLYEGVKGNKKYIFYNLLILLNKLVTKDIKNIILNKAMVLVAM